MNFFFRVIWDECGANHLSHIRPASTLRSDAVKNKFLLGTILSKLCFGFWSQGCVSVNRKYFFYSFISYNSVHCDTLRKCLTVIHVLKKKKINLVILYKQYNIKTKEKFIIDAYLNFFSQDKNRSKINLKSLTFL